MSFKDAVCNDGKEFEKIVNWITVKIREFLKRNGEFIEPYVGFKDDLKNIVALSLLEKRERLCKKHNLNLSYVLISVKHHIIDKYFRVKHLYSVHFSDFADEIDIPPEERFTEYENISPLVKLNAMEAVEKLKSTLTEKELQTLCYRFYSEVSKDNPFLINKSADAKYKAWSRLRKKVADILFPFSFSEDEFKYFVSLVVSEICERIR